jgi:ATP-binding cassette subfamily B protein
MMGSADAPAVPLRELIDLLRPFRRKLAFVTVLVLVASTVELVPPLLMRWIVDDHLTLGRSDGLLALGGLYLMATAFGQISGFGYAYLVATLAQDLLSALRVRLFGHLQRLPADYFDNTPLGDIISRCTADLDALDTLFTSGVAALVANLFRLITIFAAMVLLSPLLALAAVLTLPPLIALTRAFQIRIRDAERTNRAAIGRMTTHLQEALAGVEVIQAFRREPHFVARFRHALHQVLRASNRATAFSSVYPPATAVMTYGSIAFLLWIGTREELASAGISIGTLTAFALLLQRFFGPLTALGDEWQTVQGALSGAERVFAVLALPEAGRAVSATAPSSTAGIECSDVVFGYRSGRPVLQRVSLRIGAGEHVALVGRTGAGKSSIVQLLAGLYQPWQGTVRIAGCDPRALDEDARRRIIGIVPQSCQIFGGTVHDNITLGDERITSGDVMRAARISGADAFISALPQGYRTVLRGSGRGAGVQLSAGEEQLLHLTRALVTAPAVLLFDEATSLLDAALEASVRIALQGIARTNRTAVLTVAHRLATARHADRVIVLDAGRIVETGDPESLVRRGGRFAALLDMEAAGWDWRLDPIARTGGSETAANVP